MLLRFVLRNTFNTGTAAGGSAGAVAEASELVGFVVATPKSSCSITGERLSTVVGCTGVVGRLVRGDSPITVFSPSYMINID